MGYPPAPWSLQGYAIQTLHPIPIQRARMYVPSELEIISVMPGQTLGGIYASRYESGSTLEYSEMIVVAALTRYRHQIGVWISHIYVDNEDSVAGGREIWELPKELAQFTWGDNSVSIRQDKRELCRLSYRKEWYSFSTWWQQPYSGNVFSGLDSRLLTFEAQLAAQFGLLQGTVVIPTDSPLAKLQLEQQWFTVEACNLKATVREPIAIGEIVQVYR